MKKLIFVMLFSLAFLVPPAFTTGTPQISMPEINWNFGRIKEGAVVKHVFVIQNSGSAELVISAAIVSCGCTRAVVVGDRIAPRKTGKLKVAFDSKGRSGFSSNTIKVCSNDPGKPYLRVRVWGTVVEN